MTYRCLPGLLALSIVAAWAGAGVAADPSKAPRVLMVLTPADIDAAGLLPPPPPEGSPRAAAELAELAELRAIEAGVSEGARAQARSDDAVKDGSIFAEAIGPEFDLTRLPATARLLDLVRNEEKGAADRAKALFRRKRPWIVDPKLKSCSTDDEALSSYPSGHATMGYAMGVVLAHLIPARAQPILQRSARYAEARLICEVHFRSDIVASQALGTAVAVEMLRSPTLQPTLTAAAAELRAASIGR